jgi:hypothetical protein
MVAVFVAIRRPRTARISELLAARTPKPAAFRAADGVTDVTGRGQGR